MSCLWIAVGLGVCLLGTAEPTKAQADTEAMPEAVHSNLSHQSEIAGTDSVMLSVQKSETYGDRLWDFMNAPVPPDSDMTPKNMQNQPTVADPRATHQSMPNVLPQALKRKLSVAPPDTQTARVSPETDTAAAQSTATLTADKGLSGTAQPLEMGPKGANVTPQSDTKASEESSTSITSKGGGGALVLQPEADQSLTKQSSDSLSSTQHSSAQSSSTQSSSTQSSSTQSSSAQSSSAQSSSTQSSSTQSSSAQSSDIVSSTQSSSTPTSDILSSTKNSPTKSVKKNTNNKGEDESASDALQSNTDKPLPVDHSKAAKTLPEPIPTTHIRLLPPPPVSGAQPHAQTANTSPLTITAIESSSQSPPLLSTAQMENPPNAEPQPNTPQAAAEPQSITPQAQAKAAEPQPNTFSQAKAAAEPLSVSQHTAMPSAVDTSNDRSFVIAVVSSPAHFSARQAIRTTWMVDAVARNIPVKFFIGQVPPMMQALDDLIQTESDVVRLSDFTEDYHNLTAKALDIFDYAYRQAYAGVFKVDDDSFIRINRLVEFLDKQSFWPKLYAGVMARNAPVLKDPQGRWFAYDQYPHDTWPTFANGPGFFLGRVALQYIYESRSSLNPIRIDDAAVGVWTQPLNLNIVDMHASIYEYHPNADTVYQNPVNAEEMMRLYQRESFIPAACDSTQSENYCLCWGNPTLSVEMISACWQHTGAMPYRDEALRW